MSEKKELSCKRNQIELAKKNMIAIDARIEVLSRTPVEARTSKTNQEIVELYVEKEYNRQALDILCFDDTEFHRLPVKQVN